MKVIVGEKKPRGTSYPQIPVGSTFYYKEQGPTCLFLRLPNGAWGFVDNNFFTAGQFPQTEALYVVVDSHIVVEP